MILPKNNPYALWAYYCGVFSFTPVLGIPLSVVAIATGFMGIHRTRTDAQAKGVLHSSGGLLLGLLGLVLHIILFQVMGHIDFSMYRSLFHGDFNP